MEYYNVSFDSVLSNMLHEINEATELKLFNLPIGKKLNTLENSKAATWRGKLTALDKPPYILQELGYPGIIMVIMYCIELNYFLFNKNSPYTLKIIRVSMFETLFIDYLDLSLRTLGFFPFDNSHNIYDIISFIISVSIVLGYTWELLHMITECRTLSSIKNENSISKFEKERKEALFNSINPQALSKCWFARYYEVVYLTRFYLVCMFIYNLQHLKFS